MDAIFSWLHLSDIHVGHGTASGIWDQRATLLELLDELTTLPRAYPRPEAVLLTGDIAFSGGTRMRRAGPSAPTEYAEAADWLDRVCKRFGLAPDRVFMVPGNHDVQREVASSDRNVLRLLNGLRAGQDQVDSALAYPEDETLLLSRQANYLAFASHYGPRTNRPFWTKQLPTGSNVSIRLVGLNTALLAADDTDKGRLAVGQEQLVRTLLDPAVSENELVLVLTHHPLDWLSDESTVRQIFQRHAHVHLCGHVHQAESMLTSSGAGSELVRVVAGAVHELTTPGAPPVRFGYNLGSLHLGTDNLIELRTWPRAWSRAARQFRTDVDNVPDGQLYAKHRLSLRVSGSDNVIAHARPADADRALKTGQAQAAANQILNIVERVRFLRQLAEDLAAKGSGDGATALLVAAMEMTSSIVDQAQRVAEFKDLGDAFTKMGAHNRAQLAAQPHVTQHAAPLGAQIGFQATPGPPTTDPQEHGDERSPVPKAAAGATDVPSGQPVAGSSAVRVRIFVSSPADTALERAQVRDVVFELNRTLAPILGIVLELVTWETHAFPAAGRPQAIINEQIGDYEIFLGIMSCRFGTPTGDAGSGTEEEFNDALDRWRSTGKPLLLFYFSNEAAAFPESDDALAQLTKVQQFRKRVRTDALVMNYVSPRDFGSVLRPQLFQLLERNFHSADARRPTEPPAPSLEARRQVRDLGKEYELIRELMEPSDARTIRMETVLTRLRALAPEIRALLPELKASKSAGERLAAVAIIQTFPDCAHLPWLVQRFEREAGSDDQVEKPFLAYAAAEALHEAAGGLRDACEAEIRRSIDAALSLLGSRSRGSDREYVLKRALERIKKRLR